MYPSGNGRVLGNIAMLVDVASPYEPYIRAQKDAGAIAVVIVRNRSGEPGQAMYLVDGHSQADLNIPVVEIFQDPTQPDSLPKMVTDNGMFVHLYPQENKWKKCNESVFQPIFQSILSAMEVFVVLTGLWRLYEWTSTGQWMTIGVVCVVVEILASFVRLAFTLVDPFFSYRVITANPAQVLLTASFPIEIAAGILLTFFWAETLSSSNVAVVPFVSKYRKTSLFIIGLLIVLEIIVDVLRISFGENVTGFNPVYVTEALYVVVYVILTISYIICAYKILMRVKRNTGRGTFKRMRQMTVRFSGSALGYIVIIFTVVLLILYVNDPWGFKILFNLGFFGTNVAALLQVYSFKPPKHMRKSLVSGSWSNRFKSNTNGVSIQNSKSDVDGDNTNRQASRIESETESKVSKSSAATPGKETASSGSITTEVEPKSETSDSSGSQSEESAEGSTI